MSTPLYDVIGGGYARWRQEDPRLRDALWGALGHATTVVNVGAGTGSYEPATTVVAVEPSMTMIAQRPAHAALTVRAVAERLPLRDRAVDAALAVLTLHHWSDWRRGLAELQRIADRVVMLTWDPVVSATFWIHDYLDRRSLPPADEVPSPSEIVAALGGGRIEPWLVPSDCRDGFLAAYWARPQAYLDSAVRASISLFQRMPADVVDDAIARLRRDLASGAWHDRYADLLRRPTIDAGYRIVVAG